jgi:hypothetical protein
VSESEQLARQLGRVLAPLHAEREGIHEQSDAKGAGHGQFEDEGRMVRGG